MSRYLIDGRLEFGRWLWAPCRRSLMRSPWNVLVGFGVAGAVIDVPAEGHEKGIDELAADLSFVVHGRPVRISVALEACDQLGDRRRRPHALGSTWCGFLGSSKRGRVRRPHGPANR